jgi:hypothetical protein
MNKKQKRGKKIKNKIKKDEKENKTLQTVVIGKS